MITEFCAGGIAACSSTTKVSTGSTATGGKNPALRSAMIRLHAMAGLRRYRLAIMLTSEAHVLSSRLPPTGGASASASTTAVSAAPPVDLEREGAPPASEPEGDGPGLQQRARHEERCAEAAQCANDWRRDYFARSLRPLAAPLLAATREDTGAH
eukprot:CAMPEP_0180112376 /NCGR_PEP_ID=MMETSP0985-20121206/36178_1 /TAXON_ID=483367 /ORGANISM="non described non described, Strain CCMP 2436" /LENGTH=154 /DNA_ID=CAMNT_0022050733 /DNA_START=73 /DNA_END=534 /DNA_ORIENTATION=+